MGLASYAARSATTASSTGKPASVTRSMPFGVVSTAPCSRNSATRCWIERPAGEPRVARGVDAFGQPQAHQQELVRHLFARERLIGFDPMPERLRPHQPRLGPLRRRGRAPLGPDIEPSMRARSDAGIFMRAPVDQIVPAFGARSRVVGDLVGGQAGTRADRLRGVVKRAAEILVRHHKLARRVQQGERRVLLDGELIERKMLARLRECASELRRPRLRRLSRPRIDQVERIALEGRARDRDGGKRLVSRMLPPELPERCIVQRLHPERDAIDTGRAESAKARRLDAGRVGFQRHFDIGSERPVARDRVEDRADGRRLHERGRAAAEEDGGDGPSRHARGGGGDLGGKGAREAGLVDGGMTNVAVEIAVRTLRQAERPMNVDTEVRPAVSAFQDRPPRACEMPAPDARAPGPAAAGRASPRSSSRRRCGCDRRAGTSDHSRNPCRRVGATPACPRPWPRSFRHVRPARRRRARKRNAPCADSPRVPPVRATSSSTVCMACRKSFCGPAQRAE